MSKEYKIEVPLFKDGELEQFDKILDNDLDNIVSKVTEQILRDKELIFMQKVIAKQQEEIERLKTQLEQEIYANKILNSCLNDFYDIRGDEDE